MAPKIDRLAAEAKVKAASALFKRGTISNKVLA